MAFKLKDFVKETSIVTGTSADIDLNGAVTQYAAFSSFLANGDTTWWFVRNADGSEWECRLSAYISATNKLARSGTLLASSTGSAVNFSAGTKTVICGLPAPVMMLLANLLVYGGSTTAEKSAARSGLGLGVGFSAHKNGTSQTGVSNATDTKITFDTEIYDVGSCYDTATSRWTPPAGMVMLNAVIASATVMQTTGNYFYLTIYKNGSPFKFDTGPKSKGDDGVSITVLDQANGTDYYEVYAYGVANSGGTWNVAGGAGGTFFQGVHLG
jgi:hypothetical protein